MNQMNVLRTSFHQAHISDLLNNGVEDFTMLFTNKYDAFSELFIYNSLLKTEV